MSCHVEATSLGGYSRLAVNSNNSKASTSRHSSRVASSLAKLPFLLTRAFRHYPPPPGVRGAFTCFCFALWGVVPVAPIDPFPLPAQCNTDTTLHAHMHTNARRTRAAPPRVKFRKKLNLGRDREMGLERTNEQRFIHISQVFFTRTFFQKEGFYEVRSERERA